MIYEAYVAAGAPTLDEMATAVAGDETLPGSPSRDTINRLIGDSTVPAKQADVVALCTVLTRMNGGDGAQGGQQAAVLWTQIQLSERLGRPVKDLDPYDLEVHHAITMDGATGLPAYVERAHDVELHRTVAESAAGQSRLALLVGTSSTGKTRACFEAVQQLPDDWRLWHPIDPERPQAALADLSRVGPKTVVWLNEAHHYLLHPQHGEPIAAGLRTLLSDASRAPILVLGTIWPGAGYFEDLRVTPPPGAADPHAQARVLLAGRVLHVPPAFDSSEVAGIQRSQDPRLAAAARSAQDGKITQYLAAGFELTSIYKAAAPGPRALLDAAMDARRLGHPNSLPLPFLAAAAEAYLTDTEWDLLSDNWLEQSMAQLTNAVKGARGPLHAQRRPRGATVTAAGNGQAYRLADFLEAHGRSSRRLDAVPALFWQAAAQHCDNEAAQRLALSAERRGLIEKACRLWANSGDYVQVATALENLARGEEADAWYEFAASMGDILACRHRANHLARVGRLEDALVWFQRAAQAGDGDALQAAGNQLAAAGRLEDALEWFKDIGNAGATQAFVTAAHWLAAEGRLDEALEWCAHAIAAGEDSAISAAARLKEQAVLQVATASAVQPFTYPQVASDPEELLGWGGRLAHAGRIAEALPWFERAAAAGVGTKTLREVGWLLGDAGHVDEALTWLERAAQAGDPDALRTAGDQLAAAGRIDDALVWFDRAATSGDVRALRSAADVLAAARRLDEALTWFEKASDRGDSLALMMAAEWLLEAGRSTEALVRFQQASANGERHALRAAARLLVEAGYVEEALIWFERAAADGDVPSLRATARLLEAAGRMDEALIWLEKAANAGDVDALDDAVSILLRADRMREVNVWAERSLATDRSLVLRQIADHLARSGRTQEALEWFRRAVSYGDTEAFRAIANHLSLTGQLDEALPWLERAAAIGDIEALRMAGKSLAAASRWDEALTWLLRAAAAGLDDRTLAVRALTQLGRTADADQLRHYGWAGDGTIAKPWQIKLPAPASTGALRPGSS
ncbi:tetratricopeptide repeat protein [Streptomyces sp. NPDC002120]|uniref:tetratricopeptide repeat protein n=1 Tax=Streptomyces sp. NPDC002120 TaxID=3364631 RepID=UPI0036A8898E